MRLRIHCLMKNAVLKALVAMCIERLGLRIDRLMIQMESQQA